VAAIGPGYRSKFLTVPPAGACYGARDEEKEEEEEDEEEEEEEEEETDAEGQEQGHESASNHTNFCFFVSIYFSLHGRLWADGLEAGAFP
jgi:hypothetical protein